MKEIGPGIEIFSKMDNFISKGTTGPPNEFAGKLNVCERTFYDYRKIYEIFLKPFGIKIFYNSALRTYQYSSPGKLEICIRWKNNDNTSSLNLPGEISGSLSA